MMIFDKLAHLIVPQGCRRLGGSNTSAVPNKRKAVVKLLIDCNCRDRVAVQAAQLAAQERQEGSSLWPQDGTCLKEAKKQVVPRSGKMESQRCMDIGVQVCLLHPVALVIPI